MKKWFVLSFILCLTLSAFSNGGAESDEVKLGAVVHIAGIPFCEQIATGARDAGKDFGVDVEVTGPSQLDASTQINMFNSLVQAGYDGISNVPYPAEQWVVPIEKAKEAGVIVTSMNVNPLDETGGLFVGHATYSGGIALGEAVLEYLEGKEGDVVIEVNGQAVDAQTTPESLLVNQARNDVSLLIKSGKEKPKKVFVKTLTSQTAARYRDWVENNRAYVHKKTKGKVGYIHIPDMVVNGFAEFHRSFLSELDREGLIVDVRFNRGGNVSGLLLEKLSRRRLGYDKTRWYGVVPYPYDSPRGPMVGLANEYAASDGDIFSHSFKMMKLGPLIGKRTWGGVIGIWPRHSLLDGGTASQPEFSFWFHDVGWAVENYGVAPDIEVEITPQDYEKGKDPQLDRGIEEVLKIIKANPEQKPFAHEQPNLAPPRLK